MSIRAARPDTTRARHRPGTNGPGTTGHDAVVPGLNRLRAQGSAQGTSRGPIFVPGWPVKHGTRRRAGRPKSPTPKNISTDFKKIPDLKSRHELFTFHMYSKHKGKHPQIQKAKTPKTTKTNRDKFKLLGRAVCAMLPH